MPEAAGILEPCRFTLFVQDIGNDQDFRVAAEPMLLAHVLLEHAEAAGKRDLLLGCDSLVAEENHLVLEKRFGDLIERLIVQRAGKVDASYFRAEVLSQAYYIN